MILLDRHNKMADYTTKAAVQFHFGSDWTTVAASDPFLQIVSRFFRKNTLDWKEAITKAGDFLVLCDIWVIL